MRKKVTVVGAGNVGATCAMRIADKELADVVLVDVVEGVPQGKSLDLMQSGPVEGYDVTLTGSNNYEPTANSDVVVITAGLPRKPGMSRDDLLLANYEIMRQASEQAAKYSPNAILVIVSNPLDAMCWTALQVSKFSKNRVVIVENDCVIVTGNKLINTFDYLEVAEFSANSLVMASSIGQLHPMGDKEIDELRVAFNVK